MVRNISSVSHITNIVVPTVQQRYKCVCMWAQPHVSAPLAGAGRCCKESQAKSTELWTFQSGWGLRLPPLGGSTEHHRLSQSVSQSRLGVAFIFRLFHYLRCCSAQQSLRMQTHQIVEAKKKKKREKKEGDFIILLERSNCCSSWNFCSHLKEWVVEAKLSKWLQKNYTSVVRSAFYLKLFSVQADRGSHQPASTGPRLGGQSLLISGPKKKKKLRKIWGADEINVFRSDRRLCSFQKYNFHLYAVTNVKTYLLQYNFQMQYLMLSAYLKTNFYRKL